jgi:hypothetical protein
MSTQPNAAMSGPVSGAPHINDDRWKTLALGALGVVYGDIGTSPLPLEPPDTPWRDFPDLDV